MLIISPPVQIPSIQIAQIKPKPKKTSACPLTKSIYQAIAKPEFELKFSRNKSQIATEFASFTIRHKTRGSIASFNMGGSMGYGSLYLNLITSAPNENEENKLKPVFFDRNWQSVGGTPETAPQYLFVANLGVEDWYSERQGSRSQVLGDVMWKFSRCQ